MGSDNIKMAYTSRAPTTPWFERIDPIHEVEWADLIKSSWQGIYSYNHHMAVDPTGHIYHDTSSHWSPIELSEKVMYSPNTILAMAMIHEWNALSTFQLSTLLGISRNKTWNLMKNLYSAGLVLRMIPEWWKGTLQDSGSGALWKINRKSLQVQRWFEKLPNLEWALSTNGFDPSISTVGGTSPQAMRHNLAMMEIIIRSMEVCPGVVGGWGEGHTDSWMFYQQEEFESDDVRAAVADGSIVTKDGKVILFEASGSGSANNKGRSLVAKAAAWTAICGKSPLDIYMVFVEISRDPNMYHFNRHITMGMEKVSGRYVSNIDVKARGQKRILTVDSRDWFPIVRGISEDFVNLRAWCPATLEYVDLAPSSLVTDRESDVLVNTLSSLHTPRWIVDPIVDKDNQ